MTKIDEAWKLAKRIHKDQKRFNGQPYINHINDIICILKEINLLNNYTELYAILHDTIEDIKDNTDIIKELHGIEEHLPLKICLLTHTKNESYKDYIDDIASNQDINIIAVKLADMIQNLTEDPKKKQREKYRKALPILIKALIDITNKKKID